MQPHNSNDRPNSQRFQFQRELLPPPKAFYERALGKLSRPSRGWAKANCPFHSSKSKTSLSVNLEGGHFYCHGCGVKGGDVLAFVRLRDHLTFQAAAKTLGAWRDTSESERVQLDAAKAKREREREQAEAAKEAKEAERRRRIQLRDQVHTASRIWKESCARLSELRKGAEPTSDDEEELCWELMSLAVKDLHDSEEQYCSAAGSEYTE